MFVLQRVANFERKEKIWQCFYIVSWVYVVISVYDSVRVSAFIDDICANIGGYLSKNANYFTAETVLELYSKLL